MPNTVVQQFYQARVIDEFVLRGNAGLLKCNLPSFVADFVEIESWIDDDGTVIFRNSTEFGSVPSKIRYCSCIDICRLQSNNVINHMHTLNVDFRIFLIQTSPHYFNLYYRIHFTKTVHCYLYPSIDK